MTRRKNLISAKSLVARLQDPHVRIIDCRFNLGDPHAGRKAYHDAHLPGAVFADLDEDLSGPVRADSGRHPLPDRATIAATLGRLGIEKRSDVIVYDDSSGALAARAWWLLRWLGHDNVRLLDGGIKEWRKLSLPHARGAEQSTSRHFEPQPRDGMVLTTAELVDKLHAIPAMRLIDARDEARFRGEIEPIDSIAGHIPGASNLPFVASLHDDGTWKSTQELGSLWAAVLDNDRGAPWAAMCGSGVTACHLAISATEAGFREPRLYVGSWSEWIRDPGRPVAVGKP